MALLNIVIWNLGIETSIARIKNTELSLLDIPWVWIPLPAGPFSCITERTRIASGRFIAAFAWIVKGQVRTGEKWPEEEGWMQLGSYSMSMVHGISQGERGFLLFCHCLQKRVHYHTFWEHIFTKETLCPQKTNTEFLQLGSRLAVQFHLLLQCGYGRCHTGNGITGEICCTGRPFSPLFRFLCYIHHSHTVPGLSRNPPLLSSVFVQCPGWNARFESDWLRVWLQSRANVVCHSRRSLKCPVIFWRPWSDGWIPPPLRNNRSGRQCFLDDGLGFRTEGRSSERWRLNIERSVDTTDMASFNLT